MVDQPTPPAVPDRHHLEQASPTVHTNRDPLTIVCDALGTHGRELWLRSLGGGVFAALRGGLVAAITQDWLQVGVAV
ncbi:MAG: hypothetical protein ABF730_09780 [Bifidobacterium aquikefiri]|jgi:hypothetical protein|uniref:hypothetical protein n=1 Tax=Bifidobacterium aquikefiri TaxID=1653207 RepID=UPI0039EBB4F1